MLVAAAARFSENAGAGDRGRNSKEMSAETGT